MLEESYRRAAVVDSGRFLTTVNELCDQLPALRPELLRHVVSRLLATVDLAGCTKILVEEEKGAAIGTAVSLATGLPLAMARIYPYAMPGHRVAFSSEYSSGDLYVNGIVAGDRVLIVDDTLSTGGTLISVIEAVRELGATVHDVAVVVEKAANGGRDRLRTVTGIEPHALIAIDVAADRVTVQPARPTQRPAAPAEELDFLDLLPPAGGPGLFVVVEGTDGAGKTTLLDGLAQRLRADGVELFTTFQPTASVRATDVFRRFAESGDADPGLYQALYLVTLGDRLFHVNTSVRPALSAGQVVLCDRYVYTTIANAMARGQRFEPWFRAAATHLPRPDLAFLLHSPVDVALSRIRQRPDERDRPVDVGHMTRVHDAFQQVASLGHLVPLDTAQASIEETLDAAYARVAALLPAVSLTSSNGTVR